MAEIRTQPSFMPVLTTCISKCDKLFIKLKLISDGQHFAHYKSVGKFFDLQGS